MVYEFLLSRFEKICIYFEGWVIEQLPSIDKADEFINSGEEARKAIDFIITLGDSRTILWASKQFHGEHIPPLITFHLGSPNSLGFLA